jgi:hypothetical protein
MTTTHQDTVSHLTDLMNAAREAGDIETYCDLQSQLAAVLEEARSERPWHGLDSSKLDAARTELHREAMLTTLGLDWTVKPQRPVADGLSRANRRAIVGR